MNENDPVNHPKHYTFSKFEVIDVIEEWKLAYHLGNVVKYIARAKHKGKELEDLKKALWYLDRYINFLEGKREAALQNLDRRNCDFLSTGVCTCSSERESKNS